MVKVFCDFIDCLYNEHAECNKEEIYLDDRVNDIFIGCPDAEWSAYDCMNNEVEY